MTVREAIDKVSGMVILLGRKVVGRLRENVEIGQRRVDRLAREFREAGYFVIVNSNVNAGVDIQVFDRESGMLVEVCESTNYANKWEYINEERMNRYINNLTAYDSLPNVGKVIYCSFRSNVYSDKVEEQTLTKLEESQIKVVSFGYQD